MAVLQALKLNQRYIAFVTILGAKVPIGCRKPIGPFLLPCKRGIIPADLRSCHFPHVQMLRMYLRICDSAISRMHSCREWTCGFAILPFPACIDAENVPADLRSCHFPHVQMLRMYLRICESANFRWYKCRRSTCIAAVLLLVACIDAGCHAATRCRGRIPRAKATSLWLLCPTLRYAHTVRQLSVAEVGLAHPL